MTSSRTSPLPLERPALRYPVRRDGDDILVERDGYEFEIGIDGWSADQVQATLGLLDGREVDATGDELVAILVEELDRHHLLDDDAPAAVRSGLDVLLELEDLTSAYERQLMRTNPFWLHLCGDPAKINPNVIHGFAVENYHILFREGAFDSPVLCYQPSTSIRLLMNEFYVEEHGHDVLILNSLEHLGLTREMLDETMPLPGTLSLCNSLSWWAMTEPLFFFATLGVLEGKGEQDFVLDACDRLGLDAAFVEPIRAHAQINRDSNHGDLSRAIFSMIPAIDAASVERLRSLLHLFFEIYGEFYSSVPTSAGAAWFCGRRKALSRGFGFGRSFGVRKCRGDTC